MADKSIGVQDEVQEVVALVKQLDDINSQIESNEQFKTLLRQQKDITERIGLFWETIKNGMIAADIKSLKGDWGYVTIAERAVYSADVELLPAKFMKKVADLKKIELAYKLEGKLPKGVEVSTTKYLTKKIK